MFVRIYYDEYDDRLEFVDLKEFPFMEPSMDIHFWHSTIGGNSGIYITEIPDEEYNIFIDAQAALDRLKEKYANHDPDRVEYFPSTLPTNWKEGDIIQT